MTCFIAFLSLLLTNRSIFQAGAEMLKKANPYRSLIIQGKTWAVTGCVQSAELKEWHCLKLLTNIIFNSKWSVKIVLCTELRGPTPWGGFFPFFLFLPTFIYPIQAIKKYRPRFIFHWKGVRTQLFGSSLKLVVELWGFYCKGWWADHWKHSHAVVSDFISIFWTFSNYYTATA